MATIVLRSVKGSPLTNAEVDANFSNLNQELSDKLNSTLKLQAISNLSSSGLITQTGTNTVAARTIAGTTNLITVTNGNGVSGNPTINVGSNVARRDVANTFVGANEFTQNVTFSSTGAIKVPVGTEAQRTGTPAVGLFRYNSDTNSFEGYSNLGWGSIGGGATGGTGNAAFWENDITITQNYTITAGKNAGTFGPVTVANGVTVTVPSGSTWTIV